MRAIAEFASAAPNWLNFVGAAIKARDEGGEQEESVFRAADEALSDSAPLVGRLVVAVGGPDRDVARDAIGTVSFLELALEELREWPPDVEEADVEWTDQMSEEQREDAYAKAWEIAFEEAIDEARMLLTFASETFGRGFSATAGRHLDATFRDLARRFQPAIPPRLRHPVRPHSCTHQAPSRSSKA